MPAWNGMDIVLPKNFDPYRATVPGVSEWTDKVLWDTQSYAMAGTNGLDFFQTLPSNIQNGNLQQSGTVGNNALIVRSIGINPKTHIANDIGILMQNAVLMFYIGSKLYWEGLADRFPPAGGVVGSFSTGTAASTVHTATNGIPDARAGYVLTRPLLIPPNLNFKVRLEFPTAPAISAQTAVTVLLKGDIGRFVQ